MAFALGLARPRDPALKACAKDVPIQELRAHLEGMKDAVPITARNGSFG